MYIKWNLYVALILYFLIFSQFVDYCISLYGSGSQGSSRSFQEIDMVETVFLLILRHHLPFLHSFLHRGVVGISRDYISMCWRDCSDIYCSYFLSKFTNNFFLVLFSTMVYIDRSNTHTTLWRSLIILNSVKGPVNKVWELLLLYSVNFVYIFFLSGNVSGFD